MALETVLIHHVMSGSLSVVKFVESIHRSSLGAGGAARVRRPPFPLPLPLPLALPLLLAPGGPNAVPPHPPRGMLGLAVDAAAAPIDAPSSPPPPMEDAPEPSAEFWKSEGADMSLPRLLGGRNSSYFASIA